MVNQVHKLSNIKEILAQKMSVNSVPMRMINGVTNEPLKLIFKGNANNKGADLGSLISCLVSSTLLIQSFRTNRSGQTVQTQIRLLLKEQSDLGLHCLLFHLHLFDEIS